MLKSVVFIIALFSSMHLACANSLMELYEAALNADPALRSAEYEEQAVQELHRQSLANFLPSVSAQVQLQETKQKILRSDNAVFGHGSARFPTQNWTASLTQPVLHVDAWHTYDQTELGKARSALDMSAARQDLMVRLVEGYLTALAAEEDHALSVAEGATLKSELELAKIKYSSGLLSISDLRDVQARYAEVKAQELSSEAAIRDALEVLRGMVGISVSSVAYLRKDVQLPEIGSISVDDLVRRALDNNYSVKSKAIAVAMAEKESDKLFDQHYPTIDLIARYNRKDTKGSVFGGGGKVDTGEVILQFDVPIYSGGRIQAQTRESIYRKEQSKQELEAARRLIERNIRAGYATLLSSSEKISALRQSLEAKRSLYELRREGYRAGVNAMLDQLEAQRDFYIAEHDLAAARYDHLLNYIKIKQADGSLEERDLKGVDALLTNEGITTNSLEKPGPGTISESGNENAKSANSSLVEAPSDQVHEDVTSPALAGGSTPLTNTESKTVNGKVPVGGADKKAAPLAGSPAVPPDPVVGKSGGSMAGGGVKVNTKKKEALPVKAPATITEPVAGKK